MKKLYILLGTLAGASTLLAQEPEKNEQQLDRTVVVENLYNPDIMNANKINITPTLEEPQMPKKQIEYATQSHPAKQFGFTPMPNFGTTPQSDKASKGYLRLGYGNRGNVDSRLSYRLALSKRDELNANLSFRGMDGTIDFPEAIGLIDEWDARFYRTHGNLGWTHRFNPLTLGVEAEGENQVFNYPNLSQIQSNGSTHQHNLLGSVKAYVKSNNYDADFRYHAGTGVLFAKQKYAFGYYNENSSEAYTETIIRSHAQVSGDINERTSVHIAAQMDNFFSRNGGKYNDVNLTVLQLNPHLTSEGRRWKARIGMHIDPLFGNGGSDFEFAPDIYGEYAFSKAYILYAQANGGRVVNDFRTVNNMAPYAEFPIYRDGPEGSGYYLPRHSFNQLDARLGIKISPINELGVHLHGGYKITNDHLFNTYITYYSDESISSLKQDKANVLYANASVQYSWKDVITTQAELEWSKWDSDIMDKYAILAPALSFRWSANICPFSDLNIGLSYQYEQREKDFLDERPAAINNLGLTATYRLFDWLSIYAQGDNLLNQKYYLNALHPAQGLNIIAGGVIEF